MAINFILDICIYRKIRGYKAISWMFAKHVQLEGTNRRTTCPPILTSWHHGTSGRPSRYGHKIQCRDTAIGWQSNLIQPSFCRPFLVVNVRWTDLFVGLLKEACNSMKRTWQGAFGAHRATTTVNRCRSSCISFRRQFNGSAQTCLIHTTNL